MSEPLRPVPLEEQLKQDTRFSFGIELEPQSLPTLVSLIQHQEKVPASKHSTFWLRYFEGLVVESKDSKEWLERGGTNLSGFNYVHKGYFTDAIFAVNRTDDEFFESADLGRDLFEYVISIAPDEFVESFPGLREIPDRIKNRASSVEEVKEDPRFSNLLEADPDFLSDLTSLCETANGHENIHASFWLQYLEEYNLFVGGVRKDLEEENSKGSEMRGYRRVIKVWLNGSVRKAIDASRDPLFFSQGPGSGIYGRWHRGRRIEEVRDDLLLQIPDEIIRKQKSSLSN